MKRFYLQIFYMATNSKVEIAKRLLSFITVLPSKTHNFWLKQIDALSEPELDETIKTLSVICNQFEVEASEVLNEIPKDSPYEANDLIAELKQLNRFLDGEIEGFEYSQTEADLEKLLDSIE